MCDHPNDVKIMFECEWCENDTCLFEWSENDVDLHLLCPNDVKMMIQCEWCCDNDITTCEWCENDAHLLHLNDVEIMF